MPHEQKALQLKVICPKLSQHFLRTDRLSVFVLQALMLRDVTDRTGVYLHQSSVLAPQYRRTWQKSVRLAHRGAGGNRESEGRSCASGSSLSSGRAQTRRRAGNVNHSRSWRGHRPSGCWTQLCLLCLKPFELSDACDYSTLPLRAARVGGFAFIEVTDEWRSGCFLRDCLSCATMDAFFSPDRNRVLQKGQQVSIDSVLMCCGEPCGAPG